MEEESPIDLYKAQLEQVKQAILAAGETEDLVKLRDDLTELISLTEESVTETPNAAEDSNTFDDEYAAFQAALADDVSSETNQNETADLTNENVADLSYNKVDETLSELEGMKCRAPFQHDWGYLIHSNALILSVDPISDDTEAPTVKVMFCNPTHSSMLPCSFYLEGRCNYTDTECRNSHGYSVKLQDLKEYEEPDYSLVKIESKCLALYDDGLWYKATVIDHVKEDTEVHVMFDEYSEKATVDLHQILPLGMEGNTSSEESDLDESCVPLDKSDSEDEYSLPVFLWKPPQTTVRLGEWEDHTRGIGSKLMSKMGYVVGQGLGKYSDGKAEPVPIQLIPKGKSLDKIMELKELAGDQDLFDVAKKSKKKNLRKNKKRNVGKGSSGSQPQPQPKPTDMFDFINKKLRGKKGNINDLIKHGGGSTGSSQNQPSKKHISERDLNSKSDRNLNIQLLKTDEEMRTVEKEIKRLKQSLARNQDRDKGAVNRISAKIKSLEEYQHKLQSSQQTISRHKQRRNDHKKLTIF